MHVRTYVTEITYSLGMWKHASAKRVSQKKDGLIRIQKGDSLCGHGINPHVRKNLIIFFLIPSPVSLLAPEFPSPYPPGSLPCHPPTLASNSWACAIFSLIFVWFVCRHQAFFPFSLFFFSLLLIGELIAPVLPSVVGTHLYRQHRTTRLASLWINETFAPVPVSLWNVCTWF